LLDLAQFQLRAFQSSWLQSWHHQIKITKSILRNQLQCLQLGIEIQVKIFQARPYIIGCENAFDTNYSFRSDISLVDTRSQTPQVHKYPAFGKL
jgi:hypothetical protein